jgi:hypothetical protein
MIHAGYTRPIPLEVHHASFAALPKLTLQAGLANALPGTLSYTEPHTQSKRLQAESAVLIKHRKDRKKAGLKIRVDG